MAPFPEKHSTEPPQTVLHLHCMVPSSSIPAARRQAERRGPSELLFFLQLEKLRHGTSIPKGYQGGLSGQPALPFSVPLWQAFTYCWQSLQETAINLGAGPGGRLAGWAQRRSQEVQANQPRSAFLSERTTFGCPSGSQRPGPYLAPPQVPKRGQGRVHGPKPTFQRCRWGPALALNLSLLDSALLSLRAGGGG